MEAQEHVIGYDGKPYGIGDRVELHPGTDLWMRGARYGEVVGFSLTPNDRVKVKLDKLPRRKFSGSADTFRVIGDASAERDWSEFQARVARDPAEKYDSRQPLPPDWPLELPGESSARTEGGAR